MQTTNNDPNPIGAALPRLDARLKVAGAARYPSDIAVDRPAYAVLATSRIGRGTIRAINLDACRAAPGVLDVLTYQNANVVKKIGTFSTGGQAGSSIVPLASARIWHNGQPIALVVAESFEAAEEAAAKLSVDYEEEAPTASFGSPGAETVAVGDVDKKHKDPSLGDAALALSNAATSIDAQYSTPTQHHNPMELFTTTCAWDGDRLTIYEPSQFVYGLRFGVAAQLEIDPDHVRVLSRLVGGGFGSKGSVTSRTALVAFAAKRLGRPVKLVATRSQGFSIATYRAETRHHLRLGADRSGKIVAYTHESWEATSRADDYNVSGNTSTAVMYDYGAVATKVNVVKADRNTPGFMRAPPEVPYMYALECAIDELAIAAGMDPIQLRRVNETMKSPIDGRPYTSRSLVECFDQASEAFGWKSRTPTPGSMREGDWLVGWGCATATYPTQIGPCAVRIRLSPEGDALVQTATHEIGNGASNVMAQTAAAGLGLDPERVTFELGDSSLPPATVAGGSNSTASVSSAIVKACGTISDRLFGAAARLTAFAGKPATSYRLARGGVEAGEAFAPLSDVFRALGVSVIEEYAESEPEGLPDGAMGKLYKGQASLVGGPKGKKNLAFAFGAQFVEVRVHRRTHEIRVPRAVGAFAAGTILNPRTARSQLMGGMIWGISAALLEATEIDPRNARYVNDNLADYLIPVNADVSSVEVILVPERDTKINPLGVKGLGELGNVGITSAVANAVFHATGIRVRDLPIRIEALV